MRWGAGIVWVGLVFSCKGELKEDKAAIDFASDLKDICNMRTSKDNLRTGKAKAMFDRAEKSNDFGALTTEIRHYADLYHIKPCPLLQSDTWRY